MANQFEIHSFVTKLMNLRKAGRNACLTVECKDGDVIVNLQLHLHRETDYPGPQHQRTSPSRLHRRARRELARATAAANAATNPKDTAAEAVLPSQPPPSTTDAAVQADAPAPPPTADAAVQAVVQTIEEAVQAGPPPHQCEPSQGVLVLAEQGGLPPPASLPHHHRLEDLL